MAYTSREIAADRERVFAVLTDPHTYPAWLVGNVEVQEVDDGFPEPGTGFRHQVGAWPFTIADRSLVMEVERDRLLRLDVRARPFVRAVATFRLVGEGDVTVVSFEEQPRPGLVGRIVGFIVDPLAHVRNHTSLRRLADYLEDGAGATHDEPGSAATEPDVGTG